MLFGGGYSRPHGCQLHAADSRDVHDVVMGGRADLVDDDVMILDTFSSVFVWVGSHSNEVEKRTAMQAAADYIKQSKDGEDSACVHACDD